MPWMVQDGNHERNCPCLKPTKGMIASGITWVDGSDSGGECGVPYDHRFAMPGDPSLGTTQPWYRLDIGPVAAVLMSTERDFSSGSEQLRALDKLLASVDRKTHPWLLVGGHRPMYADVPYNIPSGAPLRTLVEPLLLKYKVNLAIWGHHHSYQRSCPMASNQCVSASAMAAGEVWGVTHLVIGTAGYEFSGVADPDEQAPWVAFVNNTRYGFGTIDANRTTLSFGFVRSDGGGLLDAFSLESS